MPKGYSGKHILNVLIGVYGFVFVRQKGSHAILKGLRNGKITTVTVPMHKEVFHGTLKAILRQAGIYKDDFNQNA